MKFRSEVEEVFRC